MSVKVLINGFGRIGRKCLREYIENSNYDFEIAVINGIKNTEEALFNFKYDSIYGRFNYDMKTEGTDFIIDGKRIKTMNERDVDKINWKELGIDIVVDSTGVFTEKEKAMEHIQAGAKKVILSAPGKRVDRTIVMGVNEETYDAENDTVISNASCTTNCLAPVCKVLINEFGIVKGHMTTIHAYTSNQELLDAVNKKDLRRSRAAAESIIPTTTGAAKAIGDVIPQLNGKLSGMAVRVPVSKVSLVDLVLELEQETTAEEVNAAFKKAAENDMKGILGYSEEPLVSVDYKGCNDSSTVDALSTTVNGNLVKVLSWYDNEWGYAKRLNELTQYVVEKM